MNKVFDIFKEALKSPYYAEKYKGVKVPETYEDWLKVPCLSRNDLFQNTYPASKAMLTAPLENAIVLSTGGSTGVARTVVMSNAEWDAFCEKQGEAFITLGVKPDDIIANLFVAGHLWPSFIGVHDMIAHSCGVHLPISSNISIEDIYKICRQYEPTVMVSLPTMFVFLADLAKKDGKPFKNLRLIAYAGEQLSREAEAHVRKWLGVKEIKALAYTSSDCGIMGYQTPDDGFGTYHLPQDFQFIEILDSDTMQPAEEGEFGEIVITNLVRKLQPIIRYRIGDMAKWIDKEKGIFQLAGRAGEDFKLGGAYVTIGEFERGISEFDELSMNFQLVLEDVGNQMDIILTVECDEPEKHQDTAFKLRSRLQELIKDLKGGEELGFFHKYEVVLQPLGSLPRNPITGKIKKIIDKRVL